MSGTITLPTAHSQRLEVRSEGRSLVATRTITVKGEDGRPEQLVAGQTFVHDPRHWLVKTYPHLFAPASDRTRADKATSRRTATASPVRKPPNWKPLVRLSTSTAPTVTVEIRRDAYLSMTNQAFTQRGTVETGGPLFGIPASRDAPPKIRRAGEPGPKARASGRSYHPDLEHTRREAIDLERNGGIDRWIGSWHTHPSTDGQPSDGDLQFFAWDCRELHHIGRSMDNYIALILTPNWESDYARGCHLSWVKPTLNAWHMQAVSDDQFICTPAKVERC
jgi:proteasome lid subunit RPN8/RPN11